MPNVTYQRPTDFLMIPQAQQNFYNIVIVHLTFFLDNSVSADPRLRKRSPCGRFLLVLVKQERSFESNKTAVH